MSITWTASTTPSGVSFVDVAWSSTLGLFVAIQTTTGDDKFYSSPTGVAWTARNYVSATLRPLRIVWAAGLGKFVAVGSTSGSANCTSWTSVDGLTWTNHANIIAGTVAITGLAWSEPLSRLVLIGGVFSGGIFRYHSFTSSDGASWTDQGQIDSGTNAPCGRVIWANGAFYVALSAASGTFGLASSADGITWSLLGMSGITYPQSVSVLAYDPTDDRIAAAYAFGGSASIATSDDAGGTWSDQGVVGSGTANGLIWGNNEFLLFDGADVATSPDGITWTVDSSIPTNLINGVFAPELFAYVGVGSTSTAAALC